MIRLASMCLESSTGVNRNGTDQHCAASESPCVAEEIAFGHPRDFLSNRFVYVVISARAGGLSVGVNLVPHQSCNFHCVYCEVNRQDSNRRPLDVTLMGTELQGMLDFIREGQLAKQPWYRDLPKNLLELRQVALSGNGEPTLAPQFLEAVQAVIHVRALGKPPPFKITLVTNGSGLDLPQVQQGLKRFLPSDEIWIKLDGGSTAYLENVNRLTVPLDKILGNILQVGRRRPVVIQSLFPALRGEPPSNEEIEQYAERLNFLKARGAQIQQVQIYSVMRPVANSQCSHLPLKHLMQIARTVRKQTKLHVDVF